MVVRRRILVRGRVKGADFQPFVARLAGELALGGHYQDDPVGVVIEVEGDETQVLVFEQRLREETSGEIECVDVAECSAAGDTRFVVTDPVDPGAATGGLEPGADLGVCPDCVAEFNDASDRRYRYPFISCRNCGPRLSLIRGPRRDRLGTTMDDFQMCGACLREYEDPRGRRRGDPTIACHDCGPELRITDSGGTTLTSGVEESVEMAIGALIDGLVVAVKGVGGYQLLCDATAADTVARLRSLKQARETPFAVLVADVLTAYSLAVVGEAEGLLTGQDRPIVVLPRRGSDDLAPAVSPANTASVGLQLPATPLQRLLFAPPVLEGESAPRMLVITSGNLHAEPPVIADEGDLTLGQMADLILTHDRPIARPLEESVWTWDPRCGQIPLRYGLGHAGAKIRLSDQSREVFACGADQANSMVMLRQGSACGSGESGDVQDANSFASIFPAPRPPHPPERARTIVVDCAPGRAQRQGMALSIVQGLTAIEVGHGAAHVASLAVDHEALSTELIGLVAPGAHCDQDFAELYAGRGRNPELLATRLGEDPEAWVQALIDAAARRAITTVGLSGGGFTDPDLLAWVVGKCREADLTVLTHQRFPANDSGLAFGQVALVSAGP